MVHPYAAFSTHLKCIAADVMNTVANTKIVLGGIVTTGAMWQFYEYDSTQPVRQRLKVSDTFVLRHDREESIRAIASILCFSLLKGYKDSCVALHSSWRTEVRAAKTFEIDWNYACKQRLEINVGDTVQFSHNNMHSVVSSDAAKVTIVPQANHTSVSFNAGGEYELNCGVHYNQTVVAIVEDTRAELDAAKAKADDATAAFNDIINANSGDVAAAAFQTLRDSLTQ